MNFQNQLPTYAPISEYETVYANYWYEGPSVVYKVHSEFSDGSEEIHYCGSSNLRAEEAYDDLDREME